MPKLNDVFFFFGFDHLFFYLGFLCIPPKYLPCAFVFVPVLFFPLLFPFSHRLYVSPRPVLKRWSIQSFCSSPPPLIPLKLSLKALPLKVSPTPAIDRTGYRITDQQASIIESLNPVRTHSPFITFPRRSYHRPFINMTIPPHQQSRCPSSTSSFSNPLRTGPRYRRRRSCSADSPQIASQHTITFNRRFSS